MNMDLERVKNLTLSKIDTENRKSYFLLKKPLLVAAIVSVSVVLLAGAGILFDWKVMVQGEIQRGNYGDTMIVGDGYAAMTPEESNDTDKHDIQPMPNYPDREPDRAPQPGELSLFITADDHGRAWSMDYHVTEDEILDFDHIQFLAKNAEAKIYWPQKIDDTYTIEQGFTTFYLKEDQLKTADEVFSDYGKWKNQQIFQLPDGYNKNVRMMSYQMKTPDERSFRMVVYNAISDAEVYGGNGNAVIEQLEIDGFDRVVFVNENGENSIHTWRKIKTIKTVNPEDFGKNSRPKENMIDEMYLDAPADILAWQSFDLISETLSKDELVEIIKSIDFS